MLMNISEKINNSKYNMPLKKVKKKELRRRQCRRKERVIFILKPNSYLTVKSDLGREELLDVCKAYSSQHREFICNFKLLLIFVSIFF